MTHDRRPFGFIRSEDPSMVYRPLHQTKRERLAIDAGTASLLRQAERHRAASNDRLSVVLSLILTAFALGVFFGSTLLPLVLK